MTMPYRLPVLAAALVGLLAGACSTTEIGAGPLEAATASLAPPVSKPSPDAPKDDVTLGKAHFRAGHFGLAEVHFRRAVETNRGDAEAWTGLAASYDQLKRYDLADRAYREALKLTGPTAEFLNNRGYSYLLRGDVRRASEDLSRASALDPTSEHIRNNIDALDRRARRRV
jgi:Flp pilus assembly protein TadD